MTKKVDKQKCLPVITKNLNWEIWTEDLVTFKKYKTGLRMNNCNIVRFSEKSDF